MRRGPKVGWAVDYGTRHLGMFKSRTPGGAVVKARRAHRLTFQTDRETGGWKHVYVYLSERKAIVDRIRQLLGLGGNEQ